MPRTKGSKNGYSKDPNYKPVGKPAKKDYSYNGKLPSIRPHYNPAEYYSNKPKASNTSTIGSIRPTASPAEKYGNNPKAYSKVSVPSIRNKKMKYYDTIRDKDGNILAKYLDEKRTDAFADKQKKYNSKKAAAESARRASKYDSSIGNKASSSVSIPSIRNKEMHYDSDARSSAGKLSAQEIFNRNNADYKRRRSDYALKKTAEANAKQRSDYAGKGRMVPINEYDFEKERKQRRRKMAPIKGLINKGKRKVKKLLDSF